MFNSLIKHGFNALQTVSDNLNNYDVKQMHMINFVCIYLCLLFTLFMAGWIYQWIFLAKLDLPLLLQGVQVLGSAGVLALLRYITDVISGTKIMIDKNHNGVPDEEEPPAPEILQVKPDKNEIEKESEDTRD